MDTELSIVTTLYHSAAYISEFVDRVTKAVEKITSSYEIIMVNDGSPDDSLQIAVDLSATNSKLKVIDLSRNFGHHPAMMAGLGHSCGGMVYLIDVDLEESPEWIEDFYANLKKTESDVVFGVQQNRKGGIFEQVSGHCFYWVFNKLSGITIPGNIVTARLMTRRYVDALLSYKERSLMLAGIWACAGFKQTPMIVAKTSNSPTTYTLNKRIEVFINSITSFSSKPLFYIFYIGVIISGSAFLFGLYLIVKNLIHPIQVSGWTSMMVSLMFFSGINMSFLGLVAIYVSKLFVEAKQRPLSIVRDIYCSGKAQTVNSKRKVDL